MSSRPKGIVIAIDGPAGVGKSTIGRAVAKKIGYSFISTGKMYRALAWKAIEKGSSLEDEDLLLAMAESSKWGFVPGEDSEAMVSLDGKVLGAEITDENVGKASSAIAKFAQIRKFMKDMQRQAGIEGGVVMEGRDIGTNVFPDAELKIYLDASPEARADRRFKQLKAGGWPADYKEILEFIVKRDRQDSQRVNSPLKKAEDGIYLDSTNLSRTQVVDEILRLYSSAISGDNRDK